MESRVPAPLLGCDVGQRLVENPLVAEWVIDRGLAVRRTPSPGSHQPAERPVPPQPRPLSPPRRPSASLGASVRAPAFAVPAEPLRLRARAAAIRQAESRAMPLAYADVLDEAEDLGVPGHGGSDVGHDEYWGHSRVRCRAVREHPIRVERERDALSVAIADPARRKGALLAAK